MMEEQGKSSIAPLFQCGAINKLKFILTNQCNIHEYFNCALDQGPANEMSLSCSFMAQSTLLKSC